MKPGRRGRPFGPPDISAETQVKAVRNLRTRPFLIPGAVLVLFSLSCSGSGGGGDGAPGRGGDGGPAGSGEAGQSEGGQTGGGQTGAGASGSTAAAAPFESLITDYIQGWKDFYPERAAGMGLPEYRDRAPDRSPESVRAWVALNDSILDRIASAPDGLPLDTRIDLRLIRNQGRGEIARWRKEGAGVADTGGPQRPRDPAQAGATSGAGSPASSVDPDAFRLGGDTYEAELRRYYDMEITPEEVADRALAEIRTVRGLMAETSAGYWAEVRGSEARPDDDEALIRWALGEMEEDRASTQQESLELFTRFADEAEAFVRDAGIATLPPERTLEIVLTPASAGPAQRIGFVDPAPPFDDTAYTVLSIPTIEDTFPAREKEDFYRSFNNHFNKAIIVHELFPGHYMQAKIASRNPRQARIFFPYEPYIEGWATLVEKIALDAGWDDHDPLTYLAHLRKRLENANRAYTSVQVHCFGWTEDQVLRFSEEESLLAPQFARSLWGRLRQSPMQMTSYFMGADRLTRILDAEKARLGEDFDVRAFNDAILRAGPVPFDLIPEVLEERSR